MSEFKKSLDELIHKNVRLIHRCASDREKSFKESVKEIEEFRSLFAKDIMQLIYDESFKDQDYDEDGCCVAGYRLREMLKECGGKCE